MTRSMWNNTRWLVEFSGSKQQVQDRYGFDGSGTIVRIVRGERMRSVRGTFDEFAAALQFPWYFGFNKDAFDECIVDLGWLGQFAAITILVFDSEFVLSLEPNEYPWLMQAMNDAATIWEQRSDPVRFNVVFQSSRG